MLLLGCCDTSKAVHAHVMLSVRFAIRGALVVAADFYNTSSSSGEITPYTGTPFGFFPRAMSGFSLGFPVVFDARLSANESQRLWTILRDGNYLDADTATVTVRLLTFNAQVKTYG